VRLPTVLGDKTRGVAHNGHCAGSRSADAVAVVAVMDGAKCCLRGRFETLTESHVPRL
jgi:hypothetical protein